jgi:hypothetical protein
MQTNIFFSALVIGDENSNGPESAATLAVCSAPRETLRVKCGQEAVRLGEIAACAERVYSALPPLVSSPSSLHFSAPRAPDSLDSARRRRLRLCLDCVKFCFCTRCVAAWILIFLIGLFCLFFAFKHILVAHVSWEPFSRDFLNLTGVNLTQVAMDASDSSDSSPLLLQNWTALFSGDEFA